ncbi:hypothetical protein JVU11DRAFT_8414 [Chiua virens]|nr:hypothetical protein JVU11DRAFT_8414 [Chiua virens]
MLLDFLARELPKAGNGSNFKKSTWNAAASMMAKEYLVIKGGVKNADTYQMKKQHAAIVALKKASGFTYSDKDGAAIVLEQKDVWS